MPCAHRLFRLPPPLDKRAFSLVELSIVLVILGLLVGGVLTGKSLIRASELRSVTTQFQGFMAAHQSFRDKYFAIPGDMANATQFWGAADADPDYCPDALRAGVSGTITCNGEGDGFVDSVTAGYLPYEIPLYWQHMANAGLIAGNYNGVGNTAGSCCFMTPQNAPSGKIGTSLWSVYSSSSNPFFYYLGGQTASTPTASILNPEEMWNIDSKLDNGLPNTGNIRGSCTVGVGRTGTTATDTYILTSSTVSCYAVLYTGG